MRLFILFTTCCNFILLNVNCQTIKEQLCRHAWQQRPIANIVWNFHENGNFTAMYVLVKEKTSGLIKLKISRLILKQGKFEIEDSTKIIKVTIDSTIGMYSEDSFAVSREPILQEWHLNTTTDYKIVLSRPSIWEFEKRNLVNDQNIIVTMDGGKKRRRNTKHKT